MTTACVYCGASTPTRREYIQLARKLGHAMAMRKIELIYGGGATGMMGAIANQVLESGGKVTGIIPQFLDAIEIGHRKLDQLYVTDDMHQRKHKMAELADGFIVIPGGLGTLDEFFEILTWRQLGLHNKPIMLLDVLQFWDRLQVLIDQIIATGFAKADAAELYTRCTTVEQALDQLQPRGRSSPGLLRPPG